MGGELSGCTEETVNVFIEAALFDPIRTATTGRKLSHPVRCPLPLRARRRSGIRRDRRRARYPLDSRSVRRRSRPNLVIAGEAPDTARSYTLRAEPGAHARRHRRAAGRAERHPDRARLRASPAPVKGSTARCRPGGRMFMAKPIWWKRSAASPGSTTVPNAPMSRAHGCPSGADLAAAAHRRPLGASWPNAG